ncbi:MAG: hypothetical protein AB7S78_06590 [Candidatus Omnitrophota bacterium]
MAGLHRKGENPWLIRLQVSLVYFGSGLNKLLDPDWLSGQYFEYWMHEIIINKKYIMAASYLPPMLLSKLMGWLTIIGEFVISVFLTSKRYYSLAIWMGICFHTTALVMTWMDYGIFTIAILMSYLCFIRWPEMIEITVNPDRSLHILLKNILSRMDCDKRIIWREATDPTLSVTVNKIIFRGFIGFKKIVLYSPVFYFLMAILLSGTQGYVNSFQIRMVELIFLFFLPVPEMISLSQKYKRTVFT